MNGPRPQYPSRRKLLAIGATLAILATIAGLMAPERDERPATPPPSGQTEPDRPRR